MDGFFSFFLIIISNVMRIKLWLKESFLHRTKYPIEIQQVDVKETTHTHHEFLLFNGGCVEV